MLKTSALLWYWNIVNENLHLQTETIVERSFLQEKLRHFIKHHFIDWKKIRLFLFTQRCTTISENVHFPLLDMTSSFTLHFADQ